MRNLKLIHTMKYIIVGSLLFSFACADLAVENENSPTTDQVLSSPEDIESLVQTSFIQWWQTETALYMNGVRVGQDIYTSSWGNFDMRNRGEEPRIAYNNSPTADGGAKSLAEDPWYGFYGALVQANDFLKQLNERSLMLPSQEANVSDEDYTKMVEAAAYLMQGLTIGNLGLYFDQALIFDEETPDEELASLEFIPYADVLDIADAKLQKASDLAATLSGVTLGDNYISGFDDMTMDEEFVELINTLRARFMVLGARSSTENDAVDWGTVKTLTEDGISYDFSPMGDDQFWYNYTLLYANLTNWLRVDQRVINLMDPSQPSRYPTDGSNPGEATSDDARLESDFIYYGNEPFQSARGQYYQSQYGSGRYDEHLFAYAGGPMAHTLQAENDLMFAEAVARTNDTGNYTEAANRINETRVDRGSLTPITSADFATSAALDAILYEREIELFHSGFMQDMGDQRRLGKQQPGSMIHYPVPAKELLILQKEIYTFGGTSNAKMKGDNPFNTIKSLDKLREEVKF